MTTRQPDQQKRKLLKSAACGFVLGQFGITPVSLAYAEPETGQYLPVGLPIESSMAIGREYLGRHPEERSHATLLHLLGNRLGFKEDKPPTFSRRALAISIENDFRNEDIVFLSGWALSRTEARLCALSVV